MWMSWWLLWLWFCHWGQALGHCLNIFINIISTHQRDSRQIKVHDTLCSDHGFKDMETMSMMLSAKFFTSLVVAQLVKNLPAMRETWVWSLSWEDPLEKGRAAHSSILAWRIPWTVQSMGLQTAGHDSVSWTRLSHFHFHFWYYGLHFSVSVTNSPTHLGKPAEYGNFFSLKILEFALCFLICISSVQSLSCVWHFSTPWPQHTRPPCPSSI